MTKVKLYLGCVLILSWLWINSVETAHAWECAPKPPAVEFYEADAVFLGQVVATHNTSDAWYWKLVQTFPFVFDHPWYRTLIPGWGSEVIELNVTKAWKGVHKSPRSVVLIHPSDLFFDVGDSYLIYARKPSNNGFIYLTHDCLGTAEVIEATEDLAHLQDIPTLRLITIWDVMGWSGLIFVVMSGGVITYWQRRSRRD